MVAPHSCTEVRYCTLCTHTTHIHTMYTYIHTYTHTHIHTHIHMDKVRIHTPTIPLKSQGHCCKHSEYVQVRNKLSVGLLAIC